MGTLRTVSTITDKLNLHMVSQAKQSRRAARSIHASSYVDCGLKHYHSIKDTPAEHTFVAAYLFDGAYGNAGHDVIQEYIRQMGIVAMVPNFDYSALKRDTARVDGVLSPAIEMPLNEHTLTPEMGKVVQECMIGGRIDAMLQGDKGRYILEIKTVASKYLPGGKSNKYFGEKLAHYEAQAQLYCHLLGCEKGYILIVNRDDGTFTEYSITYDALFIEGELNRLRDLAQKIRANVAPEPEPSRGPCTFCEWESICPAFAPVFTEEVVHPCGAHIWMGTDGGKGRIRFYTAKGVQIKNCSVCQMPLDRRETVSVEEFVDMELHPEEYLNADKG